MRVNELARELKMTSKELLQKLPGLLGVTFSNHAAAMTDAQVKLARARLAEMEEEEAASAAEEKIPCPACGSAEIRKLVSLVASSQNSPHAGHSSSCGSSGKFT